MNIHDPLIPMKKPLLWIIVGVIIMGDILWWQKKGPIVDSFESCVKAGNPILESDPPVCVHQGKSFTQEGKK